MLVHWIWFATRKALSDGKKAALLEHFSDPEELYYADLASVGQAEELTGEALESLADKDLSPAEAILERCDADGQRILTCRDTLYPRRLKNIDDPPCVLYYKGRLPELDALPVIAVVGTRQASCYGLTAAKRLGYQIASCGGVVVSGMAVGIDAMALSGALTGARPVVGVLGCGADQIYPMANRALFADVERYGCILSEYPPGTPPAKWTFPRRNRIISGLSNGVLVVEAPRKSGALITAQMAAEQGRDVFVVPGNIDVPSCAGSNALLREGAIMVSSGWEILSEYQAQYPEKIIRRESPSKMTAYPDEVSAAGADPPAPEEDSSLQTRKRHTKGPEKKTVDNPPTAPYSDREAPGPALSEDERRIVEALRGGERLADAVAAEVGLTAGRFLAAATTLEVKGLLRRLPGKRLCMAGAVLHNETEKN